MNRTDPPPRLAFLHIPKTAGTAFINYLMDVYTPRKVAPPYLGSWDELPLGDPEIDLYRGHFFYRDAAVRLTDYPFAVFLRHPVERAVSQYRSWTNPANFLPGDPWRATLTPDQVAMVESVQRMNLEEFVFSHNPEIRCQMTDLQTAMLSDEVDPESPRFLVSAAANLLYRVQFFGLVERFTESIALLRKTFSQFPPYHMPRDRENRSPGRAPEVSRRVRDELVRRNQNDLALFGLACRVFASRVRPLQLPGIERRTRFGIAGE